MIIYYNKSIKYVIVRSVCCNEIPGSYMDEFITDYVGTHVYY